MPYAICRASTTCRRSSPTPARCATTCAGCCAQRRPGAARCELETDRSGTSRCMVRADPVLASPGPRAGLRAAVHRPDRAQGGRGRAPALPGRHYRAPPGHARCSSIPRRDLVYRNLLSSLVGNAQLAALEITDGVDVARMPEMLESVRASVDRTAELLEHLIWHDERRGQRPLVRFRPPRPPGPPSRPRC